MKKCRKCGSSFSADGSICKDCLENIVKGSRKVAEDGNKEEFKEFCEAEWKKELPIKLLLALGCGALFSGTFYSRIPDIDLIIIALGFTGIAFSTFGTRVKGGKGISGRPPLNDYEREVAQNKATSLGPVNLSDKVIVLNEMNAIGRHGSYNSTSLYAQSGIDTLILAGTSFYYNLYNLVSLLFGCLLLALEFQVIVSVKEAQPIVFVIGMAFTIICFQYFYRGRRLVLTISSSSD
jgi:hypothetical protein